MTGLQKKTLDFVVKSGLTEGFYLAGGTALSLKYSHRRSGEFNFFAPEIPQGFREKLGQAFKEAEKRGFEVNIETINPKDTTAFKINGVKFSFSYYPYSLIRPLDKRFSPLLLASDEDIMAMKAVAILQGGKKEDFYDFQFLLQRKSWNLENVISLCREKYGRIFVPSSFIKRLVYFEEAEKLNSYPEVEEKWKEIKEYFKKLLLDYFFGKLDNLKNNSEKYSPLP